MPVACTPYSAKKIAWTMLDLPVPLFPRMPVMPSWNLISSCRNLLKFFKTSRSMIIECLPVLFHDRGEHLAAGARDKRLLFCRELLFCEERRKLSEVIDRPDILLEGHGFLLTGGDDPEPEVEEQLPHRGQGPHVDALAVLPRKAVERDLRKRELLGTLLFHPFDDLVRDLCRVPAGAADRPAVVHRRPWQVEVADRMPCRIDHEAAFLIPDLAVREVLGGARIPCIVGDLRLVVVVAERDVIEVVGQDRAVELVLRNGRKPFVLDSGCKAVGHEHVV